MSANVPALTRPPRRRGKTLGAVLALLAMTTVVALQTAAAAEPAAASAKPPAAASAKPPTTAKPPATAKAPGKGKGKGKGKPSGTAATLTELLAAKGSEVQDCAVSGALDQGASKVQIGTHVTINGKGQIINIKTTVAVDKGPDGSKVRECIDKLIRSIQFPTSAAPMITIERNWTIAQG